MQKKYATIFCTLLAILSGCANTTSQGFATERALCRAWGQNLPTRSRSDSQQTQQEIQRLYVVFESACSQFADNISLILPVNKMSEKE